jgi:hypothetical protein
LRDAKAGLPAYGWDVLRVVALPLVILVPGGAIFDLWAESEKNRSLQAV